MQKKDMALSSLISHKEREKREWETQHLIKPHYTEHLCKKIMQNLTLPPGRPPFPNTRTGGHFVPRKQSASAPSCLRPSTKSPIGLSLIRGTPSSM